MNQNCEPKNLKAVILAGGKGTRLYPITYEIPKPLLPVKKKPIINYLIDLFFTYKIKDIIVLINKDFRSEFDWWKKRYYPSLNSNRTPKITLVEEIKPLGTFGGFWRLKTELSKSDFFVTNGDELKEINLQKMLNFHQKKKLPATIALVKVPNPQDYGVVLCKNGRVQEFLEKPKNPPTKYINSGLYLLNGKIFDYLPRRRVGKAGHPGPKFSMLEKDLFPRLAKERKLAGYKFQGKWMDTGTFERYDKALKYWK